MRSGRENINYLDDCLFADFTKLGVDNQIVLFHGVCSNINLPVSMEKTEWGTTVQIFLGLLFDSINQHVGLPLEKIVKAQKIIQSILDSKKPTIRQLCSAAGSLNFLCKALSFGRPFLRHLYDQFSHLLRHRG